jgi:hypothetical protein
MRVFARRERPHPGAQLTLFEAEDGWRYTHFPSHDFKINAAWLSVSLIAATLLSWLRLLCPGRPARPCRAEGSSVQDPAHRRPPGPRRATAQAADPGQLALGRCHRDRLGTHQRPAQAP